MPNEQLTKFISLITGPMDNLKSGRIDLIEIHAYISREKIEGSIREKVRRKPNEKEDEH